MRKDESRSFADDVSIIDFGIGIETVFEIVNDTHALVDVSVDPQSPTGSEEVWLLTLDEFSDTFVVGTAGEFTVLGDEVPTLTEWGMIIFTLLLFGYMAWVIMRRRQRVKVGI